MINIENYINEKPIFHQEFKNLLEGKTIMIFGAAGSIGKALAKQLEKMNLEHIILVDNNESALFYLLNHTIEHSNFAVVTGKVADIRNYTKIHALINHYKPDFVFNAAAYKHVSMVENNIDEGLEVNVIGTYNILKACDECEVPKFVHISTDKAVNPTNFMGMSKRLSELVCQNYETKSTNISIVRFGNVWGSNGSLIQILENKILNNEPSINITSTECTRFFMSLDRAAMLVIYAGAQKTEGKKIFVLNMGEPLNIYQLTKKVIADYNSDLKIKITDLTKGEKMHEELAYIEKKVQEDDIYEDDSHVTVDLSTLINTTNKIIDEMNADATKNYDLPNILFREITGRVEY